MIARLNLAGHSASYGCSLTPPLLSCGWGGGKGGEEMKGEKTKENSWVEGKKLFSSIEKRVITDIYLWQRCTFIYVYNKGCTNISHHLPVYALVPKAVEQSEMKE